MVYLCLPEDEREANILFNEVDTLNKRLEVVKNRLNEIVKPK